MRFAANLTMLFTELPFLERFDAARAQGFDLVECQLPYEASARDVADRLTANAQRLVMFNLPAGDWAAGDRGTACDPSRVDEFRTSVAAGVAYARTTGCGLLTCLAGIRPDGVSDEEVAATLTSNLERASRACADAGIGLLVETVNTTDAPGYALAHVDEAAALLGRLDGPPVGLSFDAYHVEREDGDAVRRLEKHRDLVRHVQVADTPHRHQPGTGALDFGALRGVLERTGYDGVVGLEFVPDPDTVTALDQARAVLGAR